MTAIRWRVLTASAAAVAVAGCGSGQSDGGDGDGDGDGGSTAAAREQQEDYRTVEQLVLEISERTSTLYEDPRVVEGEASSELGELVALYTPDSPVPGPLEEHLRELAGQGLAYQPGAGGFHEQMTVFDLSAMDDDTIRFQYCAATSVEVTGAEMEDPYLAELRTGAGEARRIDDVWRLHDMVTPTPPRAWDQARLRPDECDHMGLEQLEQIVDVTDPDLFNPPDEPDQPDQQNEEAER